jgi:hypothetical protein
MPDFSKGKSGKIREKKTGYFVRKREKRRQK